MAQEFLATTVYQIGGLSIHPSVAVPFRDQKRRGNVPQKKHLLRLVSNLHGLICQVPILTEEIGNKSLLLRSIIPIMEIETRLIPTKHHLDPILVLRGPGRGTRNFADSGREDSWNSRCRGSSGGDVWAGNFEKHPNDFVAYLDNHHKFLQVSLELEEFCYEMISQTKKDTNSFDSN